jgi:hypothetical protein
VLLLLYHHPYRLTGQYRTATALPTSTTTTLIST